MGVQRCIKKIDSKVIVGQIEKECIARDETLERYLAAVRMMEGFFKGFTIQHIERAKNTEADELAKAMVRKVVLPPDVFFQVIEDPSMKTVEPEPRMINVVQAEDRRALILAYLHHHYEPDNSTELTRMQQRAKPYQIIRDELYKTSVTRPLLHCLRRSHKSKSSSCKTIQAGFYWPSIIDNASKLVTTCPACQKFWLNTQAPSQLTQLITPSWPLQI
jgi:hypothetical protein